MEVDVPETLDTLHSALTTLEDALKPLLAVPLRDILANEEESFELAPIEQARTQILTAYLVHDLIWMYLKTAGVEPESHPVMAELERVKAYFGKLKSAEAPPAQRLQLDKEAAKRFVKNAIGSSRGQEAGPSGTHTRFDKPGDGDDKDDDDSESDEGSSTAAAREEPAAKVEVAAAPAKAQSKRPKMDPFAGYDSPKGKKSKQQQQQPVSASVSPASSAKNGASSAGSSAGLSKHQRKKAAAAKMKKGATLGSQH